MFDNRKVWEDIKSEFKIDKRQFGKKINFIEEKFRREIIFRDVAQAYYLSKNGFSKPAVILAGSTIEEILRLYLISKNIPLNGNSFYGYIKSCTDNDLLKSSISQLSNAVREFRNLVHMKCEESDRHTISTATAIGAVTAIFTICNDFVYTA